MSEQRVEALLSQIDTLREEGERLRAERDDLRSERDDLDRYLAGRTRELEALRSSLSVLVERMEQRKAEYRTYACVPCQCEASWHADEIDGWLAEIRHLLGSKGWDDEKNYARGVGVPGVGHGIYRVC
jgi:hypothetical protein